MKRELADVLAKHKKWLENEEGGESANLRWANLSDANLSGANLSGANLSGATLCNCNLDEARVSYRGQEVMVRFIDPNKNSVFSAAEDLLSALEEIRKWLHQDCSPEKAVAKLSTASEVCQIVDDAIAKAKGENR